MINYEKFIHEVNVNGEPGFVVDPRPTAFRCPAEQNRLSDSIPRSGAYKTKEQALRRAKFLHAPMRHED
jgi:hypothetical protein